MKIKIITYSFWFLVGFTSYAQTLYVETSLSSAYFKDYTNDFGMNTLDNSYSSPIELGIGGGVIFDVSKNKRLKWDLGINYNKYKINTSFVVGNTSTSTHYNLSYVSLKSGPYYSLIDKPRVKLQFHSHASFDYLVFGSNQYINEFIDLTSGHQLSKLLMNYHYGLALEIFITSENSFYISYDSKHSFRATIENDESYRLNVNSVMLGFRFKFKELEN
jgi:hypothetical protein|tara:strand:- start:3742 stop:4395 length:654 start_codon:yes stop_codon:yes gene_type:complete